MQDLKKCTFTLGSYWRKYSNKTMEETRGVECMESRKRKTLHRRKEKGIYQKSQVASYNYRPREQPVTDRNRRKGPPAGLFKGGGVTL